MQRPDPIFDSSAEQVVKPLPLFRAEALEHQQQKSYGQIILIRPLSLMLLTWLAISIVIIAAGFLVLGHYTEKVRLPGTVLTANGRTTSTGTDLRAELYLPSRWRSLVQPGTQLVLHCRSCSSPFTKQIGTVLGISDAPLNSPPISSNAVPVEPAYKIAVSLPPQAAQTSDLESPPQPGMRVEGELPLGRKPLIKWFFERSGS